MATHEQLDSTSSRPILDPTTNHQDKSSKQEAASTALKRKAAEAEITASPTIHIGTRKSALAVVQAEMVLASLKKAHPENT